MQHVITCEDEKQIYEELLDKYQYGKINENAVKNRWSDILFDVIISLRSQYVKNDIIQNIHKLNIDAVLKEYDTTDITELSMKYKIPPIMILEKIFKHVGYTKKDINNAIYNNESILTSRDEYQMKLSFKHDIFTVVDNEIQAEHAILFEKKIEDVLIKKNIIFKTQENLTDEQIKEYGRAIATPDFLIDENEKIIYNGDIIKWIDAKNFYITCNNFNVTKIKKQIKKYCERFGKGLIISNYGYCSDIQLKDTHITYFDEFVKLL